MLDSSEKGNQSWFLLIEKMSLSDFLLATL